MLRRRMKRKERNFMSGELLLLFLFVRGGVLVDGATVLVFHLCRLEHFLALVLLARRRVITWLAVAFRLVVVRVKVTRMRPVAHVHDQFSRDQQRMAYLGTTADKNSQEHDMGETAKHHAARLSGAFRPVKENYPVVQAPNCTSTKMRAAPARRSPYPRL